MVFQKKSRHPKFDWGFAWWICLGLLGENSKIVFALGLIITLLGVRILNIIFVWGGHFWSFLFRVVIMGTFLALLSNFGRRTRSNHSF